MISRCASVEPQILTDPTRGDPLGLKGSGSETVVTVNAVAASACGLAVSSAEMLVTFSFLRLGDLAWRYYGITSDDALRARWQATLDPRCTGPDFDFLDL